MKCFNNKTWMLGVVTATLLVTVIIPSLPFASATHDSSICHTTIPSTIFEDMLVPAGTTCSTAPKAILTITGNVLIESGATFTVSSITVGGNVVADGAKFVAIGNSEIGGNLIVKSSVGSSFTVNIHSKFDLEFVMIKSWPVDGSPLPSDRKDQQFYSRAC